MNTKATSKNTPASIDNYVFHASDSRGLANHGWLLSRHTFSFANYYNPDRVHFGALRVLNDDIVKPGMGFGMHPHKNMEIISIPLQGALEHKDNTGHSQVINTGDVQIMSAGSGLQHAEMNYSKNEDVNFLQIWVFPKVQNIDPRYDQKTFRTEQNKNQLINVVAPDNENALWINQDAWFYRGDYDKETNFRYYLNKADNGVYIFLIEGSVKVDDLELKPRDAIGIPQSNTLNISSSNDAKILLMEIPMNFK